MRLCASPSVSTRVPSALSKLGRRARIPAECSERQREVHPVHAEFQQRQDRLDPNLGIQTAVVCARTDLKASYEAMWMGILI